jgi:hypothetical protein
MLAILENNFEAISEILNTPSGVASVNYERNGITGNKLALSVLTLALHLLVSKPVCEPVIGAASQLLKCNASVTTNVDGRTPLWFHCASQGSKKNTEILNLLVQAGSKVNQAVTT